MELDLLEEDQIFENNSLSLFDKYGSKAAITDFAILLGGDVSSAYYTCEGNALKYRAGYWWTKTYETFAYACVVSAFGDINWRDFSFRTCGIRQLYLVLQSITSPLKK